MGQREINKETDSTIHISRRKFLNVLLGCASIGFLGIIIYPIIKFLIPPESEEIVPTNVQAGEVGELKNNSGKIFRFGNKPGILIKTPTGDIRAFSAVCTHLECTVQYRSDLQQIWCACHNGHYDLNGLNISGPPPRPLERYEVKIKADKIYVFKNRQA